MITRARADLAIGIALGMVIGIAVIAAFVFLGSEGSIDSPRISGVNSGGSAHASSPAGEAPRQPSAP
jgi:hypothetical protein